MDTRQSAQQQKDGYDRFTPVASKEVRDDFRDYHVSKLKPILDAHVHNPRGILEIGFCSGGLMERLHAMYPDAAVSGTEVRPQYVEMMRAKNYTCHHVEDEIIPGDETYDLIYGTSVLHHFSAPYRFLRHAFERLNPGGVLVFLCEAHRYNLPCAAYATVRGIWHLEKHQFKLTKGKLAAEAAKLTSRRHVFYDDAAYFFAIPPVYRIYKALHLTKFRLLSELHAVLIRENAP